MRYHDIVKDDMRNGDGLRATLFVAGCNHYCEKCHNPETWDENGGIDFEEKDLNELLEIVNKPYISGVTFSGGDPLFPSNRDEIGKIARLVKDIPEKTVWLYTGYTLQIENGEFCFVDEVTNETFTLDWLDKIDVIVDGPYIDSLNSQKYEWAGSTNQRVIDVKNTLLYKNIILKKNKNYTVDELTKQESCGCDS